MTTNSKGASMNTIYEPKGKAREYSPLALNIYDGCSHRCSYCYADAIRGTKPNAVPRAGIVDALADYLSRHQVERQVLLSFLSDPYVPEENQFGITRDCLELLQRNRVPVALLTKGGSRCLRDIDLFRQMNIKVGATLTFLDAVQSSKTEPGAALPDQRIEALRALHDAGIATWVSLEPVLDPEQTLSLIEQTHRFVDHYKIGKLNHRVNTIDWADFGSRAVRLLRDLRKPFYVKADLRVFLGGLTCEETDPDRLALKITED